MLHVKHFCEGGIDLPIYNSVLKQIDPVETKRYAGLGKVDFNEAIIQKACLEAQLLAEPKGIWQIYNYNACSYKVESTPEFLINGEKIRKHLAPAEKVIVLAVTIGEAIEKQITDYFKQGEYSYSLLLDAAATTAVEQAADDVEKAIKQYITAQGYQMIWRFSPGYGDWDIRFQPKMLHLSDAKEIGITLTESMMLIPRKSITAIIGLVPNSNEKSEIKQSCSACSKQDCLARRSS